MKKIDRSGLRQLIMETIDQRFVDEGRKKKVKEADDEEGSDKDLVNPYQDVGHGMEAEPQPEDFDPKPSVEQMRKIESVRVLIDNAFQLLKNNLDPTIIASAIDTIKGSTKHLEDLLPPETTAPATAPQKMSESRRRK